MPLIDRRTVIDRPVLVNRGNQEDEQDDEGDEGAESDTVEILGEGGGPTINGIEFEAGDYQVVAGANTAAVLTTASEEGEAFEEAFAVAAIQLKELQQEGEDIRDVGRFGLEKGVAEIGLTQPQIDVLREQPEEQDEESEEQNQDSVDEETDIEDIEEDIEEVKEDKEEDIDG